MKEPDRVFIRAAGAGRIECPPQALLVDFYLSAHPLDLGAATTTMRPKSEDRQGRKPGLSSDRKSYFLRR